MVLHGGACSIPQAQQRITIKEGSPVPGLPPPNPSIRQMSCCGTSPTPAAPDGLWHPGRLGLQQQASIAHSFRRDTAALCFHSLSLQFKCNQGQTFSVLSRYGAGPSLYLLPGAEISDDDNLTVCQPGEIMVTVVSGLCLSLSPQAQSRRSQFL